MFTQVSLRCEQTVIPRKIYLHEEHIAIHRVPRMDNKGLLQHLSAASWLQIDVITILIKIKDRADITVSILHTSSQENKFRAVRPKNKTNRNKYLGIDY